MAGRDQHLIDGGQRDRHLCGVCQARIGRFGAIDAGFARGEVCHGRGVDEAVARFDGLLGDEIISDDDKVAAVGAAKRLEGALRRGRVGQLDAAGRIEQTSADCRERKRIASAIGDAQVEGLTGCGDCEARRKRIADADVERALVGIADVLDNHGKLDEIASVDAVEIGVNRRDVELAGCNRAGECCADRTRRGERYAIGAAGSTRPRTDRVGKGPAVRLRHDALGQLKFRLFVDKLDDGVGRRRYLPGARFRARRLVGQEQSVNEIGIDDGNREQNVDARELRRRCGEVAVGEVELVAVAVLADRGANSRQGRECVGQTELGDTRCRWSAGRGSGRETRHLAGIEHRQRQEVAQLEVFELRQRQIVGDAERNGIASLDLVRGERCAAIDGIDRFCDRAGHDLERYGGIVLCGFSDSGRRGVVSNCRGNGCGV